MNNLSGNTDTELQAKLYKAEGRDDKDLLSIVNSSPKLKDIVDNLKPETLFDLLLFCNKIQVGEARYRKHSSYIEVIYEHNDCINYMLSAGLTAKTASQLAEKGIP